MSEQAPDFCPQCCSDTGLKYPRDSYPYCEDCGWPDEDFDAPIPLLGKESEDG